MRGGAAMVLTGVADAQYSGIARARDKHFLPIFRRKLQTGSAAPPNRM